MIVGLGMDLVDIPRIRAFHERWGQRGLDRLFSAAEVRYCLGQGDPGASLAARFAAKEAFFKAVGTGWGLGGDWREVEVTRADRRAPPELRVSGRAQRILRDLGAGRLHLTLTHARAVAGAVVVLES